MYKIYFKLNINLWGKMGNRAVYPIGLVYIYIYIYIYILYR